MKSFKIEVLNTVIKMTRDTGQGLTGFVALQSPDYAKYLNELEKEGRIEKYTIYNSYTPNDIWYLPKGIYSVWSDSNYMKSLSFIRKYLKIESFNNVRNVLESNEFDKLLLEYDKWVDEHKEQLEELVNLKIVDEDLITDDIQHDINVTQKNFNILKEKKYYKNNYSLKECIHKIKEDIDIEKKIINLYDELIIIHKGLNNDSELEKNKKNKKESEEELKLNVDFAKWLSSFDENEKIQTIL